MNAPFILYNSHSYHIHTEQNYKRNVFYCGQPKAHQ